MLQSKLNSQHSRKEMSQRNYFPGKQGFVKSKQNCVSLESQQDFSALCKYQRLFCLTLPFTPLSYQPVLTIPNPLSTSQL